MKHLHRTPRIAFLRMLAALLLLLLLLPTLPACSPEREVYRTGIDSFTVSSAGIATLTVGLTPDRVEALDGKILSLVEVLPGETVAEVVGRAPLCEAAAEAWTAFRFPLAEGEKNHLYSSFLVRLPDGSYLRDTPLFLTDPTPMATATQKNPTCKVIKGVNVSETELSLGDPNADYAASIGCTKGEIRVGLSALIPGSAINLAALEDLDRQVEDAYLAGLAVTLTLVPDFELGRKEMTLLLDQLAARYATGSHGGILSNIVFLAPPAMNADEASELLRLAQLAFHSRNAGVSFYLLSEGRTLEETKTFFSEVTTRISAGGDFLWGAGVVPVLSSVEAWKKDDTDAVGLDDLYDLAQFLTTSNNRKERPLLVGKVTLVHGDEEDMTASLVYAYRMAVQAGADLFFYDELRSGSTGLRTLNGEASALGRVFATIDRSDVETDRICLRAMGLEAFEALPPAEGKRLDTVGVASPGSSGDGDLVLFDFSTGDDHGFSPVGEASMPQKHDSSAWSAPVLYTWFNPTEPGVNNGIRRLLSSDELPKNSTTLSLDLLTQLPAGVEGQIRLTLVGTANGSRLLRHTSEMRIRGDSWQTVNFGIADFLSELSDGSPVLLMLEVLPDEPVDTSYVFWLRQIRAVVPATERVENTDWMLLGIVLGATGVAFLLSILLYRALSRRRRGSAE